MVSLTPLGYLIERTFKSDDMPWYWQIPTTLADASTLGFLYGIIGPTAARGSVAEGVLALQSRGVVVGWSPPLLAVALAVAGSQAQFKLMNEFGSGVRGTGLIGIAPSYHLGNDGKPWWD